MKVSNILSFIAIIFFIAGIITIAMGWCFCLVFGEPTMLDTSIGLSVALLGVLFILASFKIAKRVKKARNKIVSLLILSLLFATPSHALNMVEKFIYKKDVVRSNGTPVLVNRLTGEVKCLYRADGQEVPLEGQWKEQYQRMYDAQNGRSNPR